ncbi:MAG TPA: transcription antitermination factor NusB [Rhizomicrobium sp.]|nr:transcription antitermination factor NusB [Rhizomicrobium sp.]
MSDSRGVGSRKAAQEILGQVLRRRRPLDSALEACAGLEPRDAGFARAIASETLRRLGQLDALIRCFAPKPPPPHRAGPTLEILLAGACELMFLGVAPHAAVDGANRLAQADHKALHFKPLINAVLRRVAAEGRDILARQDAARLATPDWLWERWRRAYGEATARAIATAHLRPAPLDLVCRSEPPHGAEHLFADIFRFQRPPPLETLAGFAAGEFWVQDAAASLPARLFGAVRDERVIDLCAAPGGKTAQLAAAGAEVWAIERDAARMARLAENLDRLKLKATLVNEDLRNIRLDPAPFVLLDAPCSATGTIRRHPDIPWIKGASDVTLCEAAACELIDCAADMVAPKGLLVFAVCSLEPEEGPEQAEAFLARHRDFERVPLRVEETFGHAEFLNGAGDLRTLPCCLSDRGGMDGFYAARFRRIS